MTPEERSRQIDADRSTLKSSPGLILERHLRGVEMVQYACVENLEELERAVGAFHGPAGLELMDVDNRGHLDRFLLLVTRRLCNHLGTAAASVEYYRRSFGALPPTFAACAHRLTDEVDAFVATAHHQLIVKLRDHAAHHWLHVTTGQLRLMAAIETTIMLDLKPVRRAGANRRRRNKGRPALDPLKGLPDELELLPLVKQCRQEMTALAARLAAILTTEYRPYEVIMATTRARLRELLGL
jgi:hypothetical protein